MDTVCTYPYKISNSNSIANCSRGGALSWRLAKLSFSKIRQKINNSISQNCEEDLCTVSGPILIKYKIQNPSHTVAKDLHLSRKWAKLTVSKIRQKMNNSNFTKLWGGIVYSVWPHPYKISNSKSIAYYSRGPAFITKIGKIDIFKNLSKNQ